MNLLSPILDTLTDHVHDKTLLLVLDNCEHLLDSSAQLADHLLRAAPDLRILATSREALAIAGETVWQVPTLSVPEPQPVVDTDVKLLTLSQYEAVRLFIDRAVAVQPAFEVTNANAPSVAEVCHRLDGIPLAIELAAARVKHLPVEQIRARLDDRFRLLTGGSRAALPRQQTLRAAIDWSHDLMDEGEQVLFRRLSVFRGGWTMEAAEAVCAGDGLEDWAVLDPLGRLVDKSLVVASEGDGATRYRMLATVRQYAGERLAESGEEDAVRDRHLAYFVALADEAEPELVGPEAARWMHRLEVQHADLRSAAEWAIARENAEAGLRMGAAVWRFWEIHGEWEEGQTVLARLLELPGAERRSSSGSGALNGLGVC